MKSATKSTVTAYASLVLKIIGLILIVSSLLDYILLAIPFEFQERAWQISFVSQIVDRGIIPMVGIAFMLLGYWLESTERPSGSPLMSGVFILSSVLGLIFLLFIPLHLNNVRVQSGERIGQIEQRAGQFESEIDNRTEQINILLNDQQRLNELDQALASGQLQGPQREQLQALRDQITELKANPEALQTEIDKAQNELRARQLEAKKEAQTAAFKSALSTGLSSLLLSVGYIAIGGLGLKSMGSASMSRRRA
ncbi:MAG: HpsJ family protein [Cyanobacteriota bacterium]